MKKPIIILIFVLLFIPMVFGELSDKLLIRYTFDTATANGTTFDDMSLNGNTGTITGSTPINTTDAILGQSVLIKNSATDNYISYPDLINFLADNYSIGLFIKSQDVTNAQTIIFTETGSMLEYNNVLANRMVFVNLEGTYKKAYNSSAWVKGVWTYYTLVRNGANLSLYVNGIEGETKVTTMGTATGGGTTSTIGAQSGWSYTRYAILDEFTFWNRSLGAYEINQMYLNYMNGTNPFDLGGSGDTTAPIKTFTYPTDGNYYNNYNGFINFTTSENANCTLNNSAWVLNISDGSTYHSYFNSNYGSLPNGNIKIDFSCWDSTKNNKTDTISFYIDTTNPQSYTSANGGFFTVNQSLYFNASDNLLLSNITVSSCNYNYVNSSISQATIQKTAIVNITSCGLGNQTTNITVCDSAKNCNTSIYFWNSRARLNIKGNSSDGIPINTFSIYKNGVLSGSTTNGNYSLDNLTLGYYNITIDSIEYELNTTQININDTINGHTFVLYKSNSVLITVRNEDTNAIINTTNVSVEFSLNTDVRTYNTVNGTFYIYNLTAGEWSAKFTAQGFSTRIYSLTIGNRTSQFLNAYLTESESTTLFIIRNDETNDLVQDVSISMYRVLNGSWTVIESKSSDITGRAQFIYENDVNYRFYLSKSGYDDLLFYLNPILLDSYDIRIQPQIIINNSADFDSVSIIYSPSLFYQGINTFNFLIQSPNGNLESYGYNISYPGGSNTSMGTNALGSQLTSTINIIPNSIFDTVTIKYYYDTTTQDKKYFTAVYTIVTNGSNNYTMMENKNKHYGMGVFERTLIMVVFIIFVVGVATLIGRPIIGMALGGFVMAYFMYIGFIEWWLGALPILMIFLMLAFRGGSQ